VLLTDPVGDAEAEVTYVVDTERLLEVHYSAVPDLLEVQGGSQPPPMTDIGSEVVGAFLPGTDIWLGVDVALLRPTLASWRDLVRNPNLADTADHGDERVSYGPDGHVLQVGADLARTYEWSEPNHDRVGE
jgi:hypothetical protein